MNHIITLTLAYIQFMSSVGSVPSEQTFIDQVPAIFAEQVIKIENGKTIAEGQPALIQQLQAARQYGYPWTMEVLDVIADKEQNASTVLFSWNAENLGEYITAAMLKFDAEGKISEIKEVYSKLAGAEE